MDSQFAQKRTSTRDRMQRSVAFVEFVSLHVATRLWQEAGIFSGPVRTFPKGQ